MLKNGVIVPSSKRTSLSHICCRVCVRRSNFHPPFVVIAYAGPTTLLSMKQQVSKAILSNSFVSKTVPTFIPLKFDFACSILYQSIVFELALWAIRLELKCRLKMAGVQQIVPRGMLPESTSANYEGIAVLSHHIPVNESTRMQPQSRIVVDVRKYRFVNVRDRTRRVDNTDGHAVRKRPSDFGNCKWVIARYPNSTVRRLA